MIFPPFYIRPDAASICRTQRAQNADIDGLSDGLTVLLALVLKDGLVDRTFLSLIKDIYPYVSAQDRAAIDKLLCAEKSAARLGESGGIRCPRKCELTHSRRLAGLFSALKKYGGKDACDTLTAVERAMSMSEAMQKNPGDPLSLLNLFMPHGSLGDISGLLNIMKSMNI